MVIPTGGMYTSGDYPYPNPITPPYKELATWQAAMHEAGKYVSRDEYENAMREIESLLSKLEPYLRTGGGLMQSAADQLNDVLHLLRTGGDRRDIEDHLNHAYSIVYSLMPH